MKKLFVTFLVAVFATAVFGQSKTVIKPPELPVCVKDYIKKNMKDFTIDKAYRIEKKVDGKLMISYYVLAKKSQDKQWFSFDKDCAIVKKISEAEAQTDPPKPLPPVKVKDTKPQEKKTK